MNIEGWNCCRRNKRNQSNILEKVHVHIKEGQEQSFGGFGGFLHKLPKITRGRRIFFSSFLRTSIKQNTTDQLLLLENRFIFLLLPNHIYKFHKLRPFPYSCFQLANKIKTRPIKQNTYKLMNDSNAKDIVWLLNN